MAAILETPPHARAYSIDPLWITIETDQEVTGNAEIRLLVSEPGASDGDTLRIRWAGNDLTFTVSADTTGAFELPLRSDAGTQLAYSNLIAERLLQCETISDYFKIEVTSPGAQDLITLTQRRLEIVELIVDSTLSNIEVESESVASVTTVDNLRALVEVWSDTGSIVNDQKLLSVHAPYNLATKKVDLDISAAFRILGAHLPDPNTINFSVPPTTLANGEATSLFQKYYLRIADKYGIPAISEGLLKSDSYFALLGGLAGDARAGISPTLCHNYRRRDNKAFLKPIGTLQPDWVYFMPEEDMEVYVSLLVRWSNGTNQVYNPFGTTGVPIEHDRLYWFPSGFKQMRLDKLPNFSDPDAYIIGYDWRLGPQAESMAWPAIVHYTVLYDTPWQHYLMFTNGAGGMETVWLRGAAIGTYKPSSEEFQRPRRPGHTPQLGDFRTFGAEGRMGWEMNTGWYDDPYYLQHLRQLPLSDAWLVDTFNKRFLKVTVEAKDLADVEVDDVNLYALQFNIRAGWLDHAHNG